MQKKAVSSESILYVCLVFIVASIIVMNFNSMESPTAFAAKEPCTEPFDASKDCKTSCLDANSNSCESTCTQICHFVGNI